MSDDCNAVGIALHQTMDAAVWAKEFVRIHGITGSHDEGLMIAWFANAIMTGYDTAQRRRVEGGS